jgi:hypothetical protein
MSARDEALRLLERLESEPLDHEAIALELKALADELRKEVGGSATFLLVELDNFLDHAGATWVSAPSYGPGAETLVPPDGRFLAGVLPWATGGRSFEAHKEHVAREASRDSLAKMRGYLGA